MPTRDPQIPVNLERCALQVLIAGGWLPAEKLYPAGPATLFKMLAKGWVERKLGDSSPSLYCITTAGEFALRAAIPTTLKRKGYDPGAASRAECEEMTTAAQYHLNAANCAQMAEAAKSEPDGSVLCTARFG